VGHILTRKNQTVFPTYECHEFLVTKSWRTSWPLHSVGKQVWFFRVKMWPTGFWCGLSPQIFHNFSLISLAFIIQFFRKHRSQLWQHYFKFQKQWAIYCDWLASGMSSVLSWVTMGISGSTHTLTREPIPVPRVQYFHRSNYSQVKLLYPRVYPYPYPWWVPMGLLNDNKNIY